MGDWVLIEDKARIDALEPMYKGPWLVMERKGVNLHVQCTNTGRKSVVHINRCNKIPPVPQSSMVEELPGADELYNLGEEDPGGSSEASPSDVKQIEGLSGDHGPAPLRRSTRDRKKPLRFRDPLLY